MNPFFIPLQILVNIPQNLLGRADKVFNKKYAITTNLSSNGNAVEVAFGISGAKILAPFDDEAGINTGSKTPAAASKTTTNPMIS
jgi:hypothetical protein